MQGPFSGNHNHLRFLIIEDEEKIERIAGLCEQDWIKQSKIVVAVLSDDEHLEIHYGERGRIYSRHSAGAAIYGFLLKLVDLGLSGCWVGAYDDEAIRTELGVPHHVQVEAIIPVGYEDKKIAKKPKKKLEDALNWEKWGHERRPSIFEESDQDYRADK